MASTGNNRYALFVEKDEHAAPPRRMAADASRNPFLNQVADDSVPWQEVKKRGAPTTQLPSAPRSNVLAIRDQTRNASAQSAAANRARTVSASTTDPTDKAYDPYENWCGVCSVKLPSKAMLLSHIKQSQSDHKHYCNLCKRVFKDRNGLKNHVENSWGHGVCCNLCLSAFNNEWGLKNHFENNYAVGHQFACLTCLLGFRTQAELEKHLQLAAKHTWCESCQRRFHNQDERDEHWHKTQKHRHCLQPGCDFDGPEEAVLEEHLKRDHFQCVGCKRIFQSQTKLNNHAENCKFTVTCPQCREPYAGQAQLALHLEHCFFCEQCTFSTHHEGNYLIHMTKHASATIQCWGCDAPMRTYSSLINHLESGKCPKFPDPSRLILCLGTWWYSPLFMDLDLHAQIRTSRVNPALMRQWMDDGVITPFICRDANCEKVFGHLSSLVLHCESQACGWDIARLNMPALEKEFRQMCLRRDSASA
ncbi:hypothetical protein HBI71_178940 [Parastagonospora nodorum]|nr:hypothetical protein HBI71_178940 [Parastagonospora nodorum]KAH5327306.1 hypothetical protein HBI12_079120 [Parastagonospora nodorum]KAH5407486.1 hypothetical protein HBI47_172390 [Parastagonospora nodorum]